MSPLTLRRFRAERLLRSEFAALRSRVLARVRAKLRARGVTLDASDLESCYAQAWQGLFMAMLDGREIANPAGWLVLVTYRRAIEEHRASARLRAPDGDRDELDAGHAPSARYEPDLAARLDDRARLRHVLEGLRGRLAAREREAAALCYLHGLSRAEAAARMGLSEARMRKLMDGAGGRRPGVAGKVASLVDTVRRGEWCEQQASLMRGLAFGVLDPAGERYRLAVMHRDECPACRAYVLSLRGLAALLPPALTPGRLAAVALTGATRRRRNLRAPARAAAGGRPAGASRRGPLRPGAHAARLPRRAVNAKLLVGGMPALVAGAGCALLLGAGTARAPRGLTAGEASASPPALTASGSERRAEARTFGARPHARAAGTRRPRSASRPAPASVLANGEFRPERPAAVLAGTRPASRAGGSDAAAREFAPG
jgi:DNA-directed RNA polymerase specialized sigma24 family protein